MEEIFGIDKSSKTISGFVKNKTSIVDILKNGTEVKENSKK